MGPCESNLIKPIGQRDVYTRGQEVPVMWFRQHHPGGFVRLAIAKTSDSENSAAFDRNIIKYACFEDGCSQDTQSEVLGYLNGPNTGDPGRNGTCNSKVTIPSNLDDGEYTLQWIWFAGGVNNGDRRAVFGDYFSCSDFVIRGGQHSGKPKVVFEGGDAAIHDSTKCRYWGLPDMKYCPDAKCAKSDPKVGAPSEYLRSMGVDLSNNETPFTPPESYSKAHPESNIKLPDDFKWTPPPGYNWKEDKSNFGSQ